MKIKIIMKAIFISLLACITLMQAGSDSIFADGGFVLNHNIAYAGGGIAPYSENGATYYRGGNILEVSVSIPSNTNAVGFQEVLTYDMSQLELVTSFNEIKETMDPVFKNGSWGLNVSKYAGNSNQIHLYAVTDIPSAGKNVSGGTLARLKFRVKDVGDSIQGTPIHLNFNRFQLISNIGDTNVYSHQGYDANNDAATAFTNLPSLSFVAHKVPAVVTTPEPKPKPNLPDVEFDREVVLSKEISVAQREEIAKILSTRNYTFKTLSDEKVSGVNSFVSIIKGIAKKDSRKDKVKYRTYEISKSNTKATPVDTGSSSYSYTHYIFLLLSFIILSSTIGYNLYQDFKQRNKWRTTHE